MSRLQFVQWGMTDNDHVKAQFFSCDGCSDEVAARRKAELESVQTFVLAVAFQTPERGIASRAQ